MTTRNWNEYPTKLCKNTQSKNIPDRKDLFKVSHLNSVSQVSEHPLCISCYSNYVQVCSIVAKNLGIKLDKKKEFDIYDMANKITEWNSLIDDLWDKGKTHTLVEECLPKVETGLLSICKCIQERSYHHQICTRPILLKDRVNPVMKTKGSIHSDEVHDVFLIQLCYQMNQLYKKYIFMIDAVNLFVLKGELPKKEDKVKPFYEVTFNNCDRKLSVININETNALNKKDLVQQRLDYIDRKSSKQKIKEKGSRRQIKKKYSLYNLRDHKNKNEK